MEVTEQYTEVDYLKRFPVADSSYLSTLSPKLTFDIDSDSVLGQIRGEDLVHQDVAVWKCCALPEQRSILAISCTLPIYQVLIFSTFKVT